MSNFHAFSPIKQIFQKCSQDAWDQRAIFFFSFFLLINNNNYYYYYCEHGFPCFCYYIAVLWVSVLISHSWNKFYFKKILSFWLLLIVTFTYFFEPVLFLLLTMLKLTVVYSYGKSQWIHFFRSMAEYVKYVKYKA